MIVFILCLCREPTGQVVADHRLQCDSEVKLIMHLWQLFTIFTFNYAELQQLIAVGPQLTRIFVNCVLLKLSFVAENVLQAFQC